MCKCLGVSESGYYKFKKRQKSAHDVRDEELEILIVKLFKELGGNPGTRSLRGHLAALEQKVSRRRIVA